jgi:hypothetical protein
MNGVKVRGFTQDADRVSVQSSEHGSFLLTRRKFPFLPVKWTEINCDRNELLVLKCNGAATVIELESLGGKFGDLIIDQDHCRQRLKRGARLRLELKPNEAVFVHTASLIHPWHRDNNVGPVSAWGERRV